MKLTIGTTKRLAMHGFILLGIVVAATLITNVSLFDEALHSDLRRLGETAKPVELRNNAVIGLLGLPAASDRDAFAVGHRMAELYQAKYDSGEAVNLDEAEYLALFGEVAPDREWQMDYSALSCNPRRELGCFEQLVNELRKAPLKGDRPSLMRKRYDEIRGQKRAQELRAQDYSSQLPAYGLYMQLAKLRLAESYLSAGPSELLSELQKDTAFWHMLLSEGDSIIAKMVAVGGLWTNLQYVSELLDLETLDQAQMQVIESILQSPSKNALNIAGAFAGELRYFPGLQFPGLEEEPLIVRWLTAATLQEKATLNTYYTSFTQPIMTLSSKSADDFLRDAPNTVYAVAEDQIFPPSLYNLGGKSWLKSVGYAEVDNYVGRIHDLIGMYSLLSLKLELIKAGDTPVETIIGQSMHRNPYTGEPMNYDPKARQLSFPCFSKSTCQIEI